jgi:hypothetical protein
MSDALAVAQERHPAKLVDDDKGRAAAVAKLLAQVEAPSRR